MSRHAAQCREHELAYERVVRAIVKGEPEEARSIMASSLAAALRSWERTAPDELKQPVAWIDSDR